MIEQSCQCDECQVSRRQEPDTTHFADDATLARIAELERENAELRTALLWYRDEAEALAKNMLEKRDMAVLASVNVLALDAGNRADAAIASEKENERG